MHPSDPNNPKSAERLRLATSVERLVDDWDDDDAKQKLAETLRQKPELLSSYVDQMAVHNDLMWFSAEYLSDDVCELPEKSRVRNYRQPALAGGLAVLAASLLIGASLMWWNSLDRNTPVATVVNVTGLSTNSELSPGDRILPGPLQVEQGTVELLFESGAMVRCECPLKMDIESPMKIHLDRGRLTATVNAEASGFSVTTAHLGVVDLGTEFGVNANADFGTDVFVFSGEVLLEAGKQGTAVPESLTEGRALHVSPAHKLKRLTGVCRDPVSRTWVSAHERAFDQSGSVIAAISDNLSETHTRGFFEVVPGGLREDTRAFVDRIYQWNGLTADGMPTFLRGADLVRTFNDDKIASSLRIYVKVRTDAYVFVLWDNRCEPQPWLTQNFWNTDVDIGLDEGPPAEDFVLGKGAGASIDFPFSVWAVRVQAGDVVELGPLRNEDRGIYRSMYGIAVVGYDRQHEDALNKVPVRSFTDRSLLSPAPIDPVPIDPVQSL